VFQDTKHTTPNGREFEQLRIDILGVWVSAINLSDAVNRIADWIDNHIRQYVCVSGAHGLVECQRNQRLRTIHNEAGMVTPDGMPLVWFARLLGMSRTRRVYGPDLMRAVTERSERRGYRQFYYGSSEPVIEALKQSLLQRHPNLQIAGTFSPPFRALTAEEDRTFTQQINEAKPDIVWVGLSTPKQEMWMASHREQIDAPVMIGVGAAFDFLAGTKHQAPLWIQRNGLEWAFRLCSEPGRLWRRYAYIVPMFSILALGDIVRRFSLFLRPARSNAPFTK
jgi:N-acetylglucosaminyldiphosphoundecaprenol N-acetyl-beta-D-mannosaminyltransferase